MSEPAQSKNPLLQASRVALVTQLDAVRQTEGAFEVGRATEGAPDDPIDNFEFDYRLDDKALTSRVKFSLRVWQDGPPPVHTVTVRALFELTYRVETTPDAGDLECFAKINGLYHAWPYWREFVQSATARAGLPPLTLNTIQAADAVRLAGFKVPSPAPPKREGSKAPGTQSLGQRRKTQREGSKPE